MTTQFKQCQAGLLNVWKYKIITLDVD